MMNLLIASVDFDRLRRELLSDERESCAVLLAQPVRTPASTARLVCSDVVFPGLDDYLIRNEICAQLSPCFVARVAKTAVRANCGLVFVHTHVRGDARFSQVDDDGERELAKFLTRRRLVAPSAALVITDSGLEGRVLGSVERMSVIEIGERRIVLGEPSVEVEAPDGVATCTPLYDRQVRAFGRSGQAQLSKLRVGVVGLGGTGSIVCQQLAHLGIQDFILVDPDVVETTNLNRLANAGADDVGLAKVEVARRYVSRVAPNAKVECVTDSIIRARVARTLSTLDVVFGCTDSHGSRAVLQQLAYQYLVPCIDMGTTISVSNGRISHVMGRVQLLSPGFPCLTCSGLLDPNEVRRDMMTVFERQADPYLRGAREPAPSVMSLNGTVASLAVTMLLSFITGVPGDTRQILYNAMNSTLRKVQVRRHDDCYICSKSGALAKGDAWPLMARQD